MHTCPSLSSFPRSLDPVAIRVCREIVPGRKFSGGGWAILGLVLLLIGCGVFQVHAWTAQAWHYYGGGDCISEAAAATDFFQPERLSRRCPWLASPGRRLVSGVDAGRQVVRGPPRGALTQRLRKQT
jgi:hypothetical protein